MGSEGTDGLGGRRPCQADRASSPEGLFSLDQGPVSLSGWPTPGNWIAGNLPFFPGPKEGWAVLAAGGVVGSGFRAVGIGSRSDLCLTPSFTRWMFLSEGHILSHL